MRLGRAAILALAALPISAGAASPDPEECFDALISARIVRQIPTAIPDCGDDCVVMSWPWFVELDVERVLQGTAPTGRLIVLTVQHANYRDDLGVRRWWLRRNSLGWFNMLRLGDGERSPRCAPGSGAAVPYLGAPDGETLDDVLRDSERARAGRPGL